MSDHPTRPLPTPTADRDPPTVDHHGPAPVAPPPPRVGRYELLGEIARGGMGVVYRARDTSLGRDVAVKVLRDRPAANPGIVHRFVAEAQITGQLQHPGIPPVHEIGELPDGSPFLAMKLIEGRTLAELLAEEAAPRADLPRFVAVFEQICQSVAYAHAKGVVHRDLKPSNVMVGAFGEVQVMDWGLAKVLGDGDRPGPDAAVPAVSPEATTDGAVLGTPAFIPPEQAAGDVGRVDVRADVFGLGAVLCAVLTGKPPFVGSDTLSTLTRAVAGNVADAFDRLDRCGAYPELVALCKRCLAPAPADRPADAGAVAAAVADLRAAAEERARRAELDRAAANARTAEERKRRRAQLALAAAVLLLVAGGGAAAWWYQRDQAAREREEAARQQAADREREEAARQQAADRDRERAGAEAAVAQAGQFVRDGQWAAADDRLAQALAGLSPAADPDVRARLKKARSEAKFLARLDDIRVQRLRVDRGEARAAPRYADYATIFREAGCDLTAGDPADLAARITRFGRAEVVTALDDWALVEPDATTRGRLWRVTRLVTGDAWRDRFAAGGTLTQMMDDLTLLADVLPAHLLASLGYELYAAGKPVALWVLRTGCGRFPTDFWVNYFTGFVLTKAGVYAEAQACYRAALMRRPDSWETWMNLGFACSYAEDHEAARTAFARAAALSPQDPKAVIALGGRLAFVGEFGPARAALRKATEMSPEDPIAWLSLGMVCFRWGEFDEAGRAFDEAVRRGTSAAEFESFRAIMKTWAERNRRPVGTPPDLTGQTPAGLLDLAEFCDQPFRREYRTAADLTARAYEQEPKVADRRPASRYLAAKAAAKLLAGAAADAGDLTAADRAAYSKRSREWLAADLKSNRSVAALGLPAGREQALGWARRALKDPDLAGVRDPKGLAALPADERAAWQRFWADVSRFAWQVAGPPP